MNEFPYVSSCNWRTVGKFTDNAKPMIVIVHRHGDHYLREINDNYPHLLEFDGVWTGSLMHAKFFQSLEEARAYHLYWKHINRGLEKGVEFRVLGLGWIESSAKGD